MPEMPGAIGRYDIKRELGRGMMGVVYEAVDRELGRRVAVKVINLAFSPSDQERTVFEQRFIEEARAAASLAHPGIVVVHDVGRDPGTETVFMVLEYVEGRTLAEIFKTPMPWRRALEITAQVARALHHAHSHGIVHRDVKPANIMILPSGQPKIMDFGVAKSQSAHIKLTATGQFFGTPLYMAPEQALGRTVDGRADLFSLGSIAYALLTGRQAFEADNVTEILLRVVDKRPTAPSELAAEVPQDVNYVIARTLAKDPSERYPDGKTLAEDLEDILRGHPPRHRTGWKATAAGVVMPSAKTGGTEMLDLELLPQEVASPQKATQVRALPSRGAHPGKARPVHTRGIFWVALLAAVVAASPLLYLETRKWRASPLPPSIPAPSPTGTLSSEPTPPPTPIATAPPRVAKPSGKLSIVFEHTLKSGTLRIWLDDALVVDAGLEGRVTRSIAGIQVRKGRVERVIDATPGAHSLRVSVAWEDKLKEGSVTGTVREGETSRVQIGLGRLVKKLSVDWKDRS